MSHLMSGRNKPSLDFVLKIIKKFPEVDLYWLLNGEGSFPKKKTPSTSIKEEAPKKIKTTSVLPTPSLFDQKDTKEELISNTQFSERQKKLIKVILLYEDGTFSEFNP